MRVIHSLLKFFFLSVPVINAAADVTIGFFPEKISFHTGHLRAILILFLIFFSINKINFKLKPVFLISIFLLYCFVLLFGSSNFLFSLQEYLKFFISLAMFPLAFVYVKNPNDIKLIHRSFLVASLIIIGQFIFAQITQFGERAYSVGIYLGGSEIQVTYVLAYVAICFPSILIFDKSLKQTFFNSIMIANLIFVILAFRRSSILAVFIGFMVLFLFGSNRKLLGRIFILVGIGALLVGIFFGEEITLLLDSRLNIEDEMQRGNNRFGEFSFVMQPYLDGNLKEILFGKEIFNSINLEMFRNTATKIRPLHVDYNNIIFGMGLFGIILYFLIFYQITKSFLVAYNQLAEFNQKHELKAVFFAILLSNFIFSTSGQIWEISGLSFVFLYLGSLTSVSLQSTNIIGISSK